jgi:hypothetical protein
MNIVSLESEANAIKAKVISLRQKYQRLMDDAQKVVDICYDQHPVLCKQIRDTKSRINVLTKGVAATEAIESTGLASKPQQEAVAEAFVLKKAYREAAAIAHPDKGGTDADFVAINAAYKSGDLTALIEYVSARSTDWQAQVEYWQAQQQRPEIQWKKFQSQPEFVLVQLYLAGKKEAAFNHAELLLKTILASLLFQLSHTGENHG